MANLTEKQKRFVSEYLIDLNATQAAIRAGYSKKTADRIGAELLGKTWVAAAIREAIDRRQKRVEITQERVLQELAAIAFASGADFAEVSENGSVNIIPTKELAQDKRKAIASIKKGRYGTEVSTYDKVRALEMLGKHLGMFERDNGAVIEQENNLFEVIKQSTGEEIDTSEIPEIEPEAAAGNDMVEPPEV